ncbi:DUF1826 domain-containing protein [Sphingomonas sp. GB1N7]|uniref:DUF1826 domain-containing protein n=1 Tax=Parasphingomonas caseinilytica TaxID=3096158 RepID=UPI002FCA3B72
MASSRYTAPEHVRFDRSPEILRSIVEPEVTLSVWDRPTPMVIGPFDDFTTVRFVAAIEDVAAKLEQMVADTCTQHWRVPLAADIALLARLYARIMQIDAVEIRLERVTDNACWKFHCDYVSVRLITTYRGQATQWLDQAGAAASKAGRTVAPHQLETGAVGLFKGRTLAGDAAIVHRSPPIDGLGEDRLLLVIDPAPPAARE